ncbi:hypothetical protein Tcan_01038, partial [Toxocara canis]
PYAPCPTCNDSLNRYPFSAHSSHRPCFLSFESNAKDARVTLIQWPSSIFESYLHGQNENWLVHMQARPQRFGKQDNPASAYSCSFIISTPSLPCVRYLPHLITMTAAKFLKCP